MASTTKLMTAYLALRELRLDELIVAPPYDPIPGESLLGLRAGERITVHDLLYGLLLASGNDAAATLAEGVSGSESAFVAEMNDAAERIGLPHTSYGNPIGLDEPDNYSSASDLVELAVLLLRDPAFRRVVDSPASRLDGGERVREIVNRNNLVRTVPWINGVKTGHTFAAGYVLVGSGTRKGVTLVSAVLGTASEVARDQATLDLLRYGFSLYDRREAVSARERLDRVALRFRDQSLPLLASEDLRVTVRRGQDVRARVSAPDEVDGPIARGDRLGSVTVSVGGDAAGRVPLIAARSVAAATIVDRADAALPGGRAVVWIAAAALVIALLVALTAAVSPMLRRRAQPR